MSWEPGWTDSHEVTSSGNIDILADRVRNQTQQANNREKLEALIATYEEILAIEPLHRDTLIYLCNYYTLLGAGYTQDRSGKADTYKRAISYCEQAMYLVPAFRELVEQGENVWGASVALGANDADAMGHWATAVLYYFKEVVPDPLKILEARWLSRARMVMERVEKVYPEWNGGANYFNLGIYYLAIPKSMGGDLDRTKEYFAKAVDAGPDWLLTPWGKAKYYYPLTGDRQAFDRDLIWILSKNPRKTGEPYPWSIYFQTEARELQARADVLF